MRTFRGVVSIVALFLARQGLLAQTEPAPESLQWAFAPSLLPTGSMIALVSGDPTAPGQSTIALSMPDGYRIPPHFHPTYEHVEVKKGVLLVGMGDRFDAKKTLPLQMGDSLTAPAGMHHYSVAKGPTIVYVTFIGPYTITYMNEYEAPRQGPFPYGYR